MKNKTIIIFQNIEMSVFTTNIKHNVYGKFIQCSV